MAFLYPWGNTQQLNLNWILQKIKELEAGDASLESIANALISATYEPQNYNEGDIVFHDGKLYKANQSITVETWDPSHWDEILLGDEITELIAKTQNVVNSVRVTAGPGVNTSVLQEKHNGGSYNNLLFITPDPTNPGDNKALSTYYGQALEQRLVKHFFPLDGKKICIYGDSISDESFTPVGFAAQPNWVANLRTKVTDNTTIQNNSIASTSLTGSPNGIAQRLYDDANNGLLGDADIIIIFGGVNDFRNGRTIGDYSSAADYTTVWGAIRWMYQTIADFAYNAKVYFVSPLKEYGYESYPATNDPCKPLSMYRAAIQAACKWYGFLFIDGYSAPILNPYYPDLTAIYQPDKMHPSNAYAPILCDYICRKVCNDDSMNLGEETNVINLASYAATGITVSSINGYFKQQTGELTIVGSVEYTRGSVARVDIITGLPVHLRPRHYVTTTPYGTLSGTSMAARVFANTSGDIALSFMATPSGTGTGSIIFEISYKPVCTMALSNVSM